MIGQYSIKKGKLKIKTSAGKFKGIAFENQIVLKYKYDRFGRYELFFDKIRPTKLDLLEKIDSTHFNSRS